MAFVNTAFENFSLYKQNEDAGGYNVVLLPGNKGADVGFNVNQNHPDPVKGDIYRDVRFRQAISLAIDRDDLNNALFFGLATPRQFTILPSATYYKPEWGEAYAGFDPDRANELLDAVGLQERDRQGFRVGADGNTFELVVEYGVGGESADPTTSLELVKEYWENVGLKVLLKSWESAYFGERRADPEHELMFHAEQMKEVRSFMVERESWTAARTWGPLWHVWLLADANVKDGSSTLAEYGGTLPGEEPPEYVKQLFQYGRRQDSDQARFAGVPGTVPEDLRLACRATGAYRCRWPSPGGLHCRQEPRQRTDRVLHRDWRLDRPQHHGRPTVFQAVGFAAF